MADKPDMAEIAGFNKAKLKTMETQEKNTLPTKETIEQEKQAKITSIQKAEKQDEGQVKTKMKDDRAWPRGEAREAHAGPTCPRDLRGGAFRSGCFKV
ncbi:hypothetical protein DBR06_SOUSAS1410047 [Sousa chinensis]|uniref:Thymosin beta-10 n=2 Tax=Delphinidae TaxID=9726 RepID=A0A484GRM9_SOUCH|nr:hypothetical protein DBR06_SOUSAS1410047 [Sousa chinensis]